MAAENRTKTPLWNWKFILLILMTLMNGTAGMMTVPLVAKYALALGAELTLASTKSSSERGSFSPFTILYFLSSPLIPVFLTTIQAKDSSITSTSAISKYLRSGMQ